MFFDPLEENSGSRLDHRHWTPLIYAPVGLAINTYCIWGEGGMLSQATQNLVPRVRTIITLL